MGEGLYFITGLSRYIGQTVTIFTTSGGQSGSGFTGVLASVDCNFVKLITQIGPAPGCALGNPCDCEDSEDSLGGGLGNSRSRSRSRSRSSFYGYGLGSIVEIPIERIASFVHNSVGSGW